MLTGIILIVLGVLYLIKPDIYNRGIWKRTSVTQNNLSAKKYVIYMRVLGVILIVLGAYLVLNAYVNNVFSLHN